MPKQKKTDPKAPWGRRVDGKPKLKPGRKPAKVPKQPKKTTR